MGKKSLNNCTNCKHLQIAQEDQDRYNKDLLIYKICNTAQNCKGTYQFKCTHQFKETNRFKRKQGMDWLQNRCPLFKQSK